MHAQTSQGTEGARPLSPEEALRSFRVKPGLKVELVASEPLVQDPVAIDWGADGKLWVCEMHDYPSGLDNSWQPGGRVKFLRDDNGDGRYDAATLFLEGVPFPTGVTAWGKGVLVCAAPDILYAEDTDSDGRADRVQKLFTGFFTDNFQARVNSLSIGLDNQIHGANGLLGGTIRPIENSLWPAAPQAVDIRNRDFRIDPATGVLEPVSGLTQYGRARDDWGNWFGCDNSRLLLHFPYSEAYLLRNPRVPGPNPVRDLTARPEGNRLYPTSPLLERFNDPWHANRVTSACGLAIYRDTLLGAEYFGNAFICEPVHNLVHREIVEPGLAFASRRPGDEEESEFLSSSDNWFRPAQARCGPDGALYIVDMYRFLIEHPRWIPAARLAKIDIRAGANRGRIYRVAPENAALRPIRDLTRLERDELVAALETPNGIERDRVHIELLLRKDKKAATGLRRLADRSALPQVRLQALSVLEGLSQLQPAALRRALEDRDPNVRAHALRLAEPHLRVEARLGKPMLDSILRLTNDPAPAVVRQLAFTLGESPAREAGRALGALARAWLTNSEIRAAVLSAARNHCGQILEAVAESEAPGRSEWLEPLVATAAHSRDAGLILQAIRVVLPSEGEALDPSRMTAVATLIESVEQGETKLETVLDRPTARRVSEILAAAARLADDPQAPGPARAAAIRLLGQTRTTDALGQLCRLAVNPAEEIRRAAIAALKASRDPAIASGILSLWPQAPLNARSELIALLLEREEWIHPLLQAVRENVVQRHDFTRADRQRLAAHSDSALRQAAGELLPVESMTGRSEVLARYASTSPVGSDAKSGRELFQKNCAPCHALEGLGQNVGPDLAPLRNREPEYWIKNILDPNAVVEPRFVSYNIDLKDGRALSGLIKNESATSLAIVAANGVSETVLRSEIESIRPSALSLMPEGLEEAIPPDAMGDLLAFLAPAAPSSSADEVLRNPAAVARLILDPSQPESVRNTAVQANPQFAAALIEQMTRDLRPGTPEEYARIPWIWRVAIACGKRNDASQIKAMLAVSLPDSEGPLHDWQAVVVGGGIVNGLSQRGLWPAERIGEVLANDPSLKARWSRALDLAAEMADNDKIPNGTRYDALRMIALQGWSRRGEQLLRYLAKGTNSELQMGAISGLADIGAPDAVAALREALPGLEGQNRALAEAALHRRR